MSDKTILSRTHVRANLYRLLDELGSDARPEMIIRAFDYMLRGRAVPVDLLNEMAPVIDSFVNGILSSMPATSRYLQILRSGHADQDPVHDDEDDNEETLDTRQL